MKIKKVVSSKIGQIVISVAEKMVAKIGDNYLNGKYNDGDGNFDFDNVNFEDVFYEATIETLIEKGLGGQADKLLKALEKIKKTSDGFSQVSSDFFNNLISQELLTAFNKLSEKVLLKKEILRNELLLNKYFESGKKVWPEKYSTSPVDSSSWAVRIRYRSTWTSGRRP